MTLEDKISLTCDLLILSLERYYMDGTTPEEMGGDAFLVRRNANNEKIEELFKKFKTDGH